MLLAKKRVSWVVAAVGILLFAAVPSSATTTYWDVGVDFETGFNPYNAWSFGYTGSLQGDTYTFTLYDRMSLNDGGMPIDRWRRATDPAEPCVWHNNSGTPYNDGLVTTPATGVGMHPGPQSWASWGDVTIVRWTAPYDGTFKVEAVWSDLWNGGGATTDVHLRHNRISLFDGTVWQGTGSSTTLYIYCLQGDTLDFTVGTGNGDYGCDPTGLDAKISLVWDVGEDFSTASNPDGDWSYGYTGSGQGSNYTFTLYDWMRLNFSGPLDLWRRSLDNNEPGVWHNDSGVAYNDGLSTTPPTGVGMHPGPAAWAAWGDITMARWTAPCVGLFNVGAAWSDLWNGGGATTDVHLCHNRISLFDGTVWQGTGCSAVGMIPCSQGDTVDFTVGNGGNDYPCDPTGLDTEISGASCWNPSDAFSGSKGNPNGVWTYGYTSALGATLTTYPSITTGSWNINWNNLDSDAFGKPNKNFTLVAHQEDGWPHGMYWDPGTFCLASPIGGADYKTVVRWIAPFSTTVYISVRFTGQNHIEGASSDVHVLYNSQTAPTLFTGTVLGFIGRAANNYTDGFGTSPLQTYSGAITVAKGDTIDFVAGNNGGAFPYAGWDQIGLDAVISSTSGIVAGRVTRSSDGAPISGATIKLGAATLATSDANGYYTTTEVANGLQTLTAVKTGYTDTNGQVYVKASVTNTLNFAMGDNLGAQSGWVSGVVKEGNNPISGAKVSSGDYQTVTGSNGSYTLHLPAGTCSVLAQANSYTSQQANGVVVTQGYTTTQDFNLTISKTLWNAEGDFSISNGNPYNEWSYCYGPSCTLYTSTGTGSGLEWWKHATNDMPNVKHNPTSSDITLLLGGSNVCWPAHSLSLDPGAGGVESAVRWKAPLAATRIYEVMVLFNDIYLDSLTSADVHILQNNISIFDGQIRSRSEGPTPRLAQPMQWYTTTIALSENAAIDFTIDDGEDYSCFSDTAQLSAKITYIPSPDPVVVTNTQVGSYTGLLVKTTGTVQSVDTTNKYFYIYDGTLPGGLRVSYANLARHSKFSPPSVAQSVTVTGASTKTNAGGVIPMLQVRWQADM